VSQSTQLPASFAEISEAVQERFREAVVIDTICLSTKRRQEELTNMAGKVDAIVVVGGLESANTRRLFELASRMKPSFLVQTADQLDPGEFKRVETVGLTAGASTPDFVIQAVRERLEKMRVTA
jgi:4-hydroxy-3-methylbut-2-enyl diphosphate reductase